MKCYDCPRACGADRDGGEYGACRCGRNARIAKVIDGFDYEEPCLGTVTAVFFGGCALGCSYCQNREISRGSVGAEYSDAELAALFDRAKHSLDLVTPSHFIGAIERASELRKNKTIGIIYNTSGYETIRAVERAARFTDVFLTDYKYSDACTGERFSHAPDYFTVAAKAVAAMRRAVADEWSLENGRKILKRGLIVRHLVLPGCVENTIKALDVIADVAGTDVTLSLMSQFTPNGAGEPNRRLGKLEYKIAIEHALKLGFKNGYMQEPSSADGKYTPDFGEANKK